MRFLFEDYALDTGLRELRRGAEHVPIAPQAFDLLDYLIRNRQRVVSRDELIEAVWNGRIVSDAALTTRVNVARSAIGDSGEQQRLIKTLPRRGFRFVGTVLQQANGDNESVAAGLPLPDKPSIAVLPFVSLSSDPEQGYFADGIVEDITMALSRFPWLFVIARNSSFTYKAAPVDVKQVGRDLGVRYLLQGSVRKAENRIRIGGQLIDANSGAHLWADHFDGTLEDVFDLQDRVTTSVVGAIAPKLEREEVKRARHKPTENLTAYDHYLRGLAKANLWTKESNLEALQLFRRAIELDPAMATAYAMAAWCHVRRQANGGAELRPQDRTEATGLAREALRLGKTDPLALCMGGYTLAFIAHEFVDAADFIDRGLALNSNLAVGWALSAWLRIWIGEPELALHNVARGMRLSPVDPGTFVMHGASAYAHFLLGDYETASSCANRSLKENTKFLLAKCIFVASIALAGRPEEAQATINQMSDHERNVCVSDLKTLAPFRHAKNLAALARGLHEAGLRK